MHIRGQWLVLAAAVLWGTNGTAQALAPPGAPPITLGASRLIIGGIGLLAVALFGGAMRQTRRWPVLATLLAAIMIAAYQLLFFAGIKRTGVAIGTIAGIGSAPIMAGLLTLIVERRFAGWRWLIATGLAVCGCTLLVAAGSRIQVDQLGVLLAMGAGASYAIYTMATKRLLNENPPQAVQAVVFCIGALFLLPLFLRSDLSWMRLLNGWVVALYLGLVTVAVAYTCFGFGLRSVSSSDAVTLTLAEPLTAGLLGILVLGERLTIPALLGVGLILAGLAVITFIR
jgi:drug/metabolite transporter, DME family